MTAYLLSYFLDHLSTLYRLPAFWYERYINLGQQSSSLFVTWNLPPFFQTLLHAALCFRWKMDNETIYTTVVVFHMSDHGTELNS
jgi:hypothetical protein